MSIDPKSRALKYNSISLLDVRAAVEFVSDNIEAFGGDPDNIMVRTINIPFPLLYSRWTQLTRLFSSGASQRVHL